MDRTAAESVSYRMFRIFFAFTVTGTIIFTLLSVYYQTTRVHDDLMAESQTLTKLLADNVRIGVFSESREQLNDTVSSIMSHREVLSVSVLSIDGRELFRKVRAGYAPIQSDAHQKKTATNRGRSFFTARDMIELAEPVVLDSAPSTEESIYFSAPAGGSERRIIGSVKILFDTSSLAASTISIIIQNVAVALILLVIGTMLIFYVLEKALRPLRQLTEEVRMLGAGMEIEKISVKSEDEIGRLATAFNEMADSLKKREHQAKELEQRLRHAEKMEAVGTLARGIAHDFNNILTAVEGSMFALNKNIGRDHPMHKYLYHMGNSLSRARILIQGLLVFSQGQTPKQMPVEVNSAIENLLPMISSVIGDEIECVPLLCKSPLIIMADPFQIEQVLLNLAINARDAMSNGGSLAIRTDLIEVEEHNAAGAVLPAPGKYALISVRDTGRGIREEIRERIFEPFYTTKEVGKGTGLGLSIVYGIVEEHRGGISVFSEEGRGAEFRICLPLFEKE
jgi:signal transduction histidine kinase